MRRYEFKQDGHRVRVALEREYYRLERDDGWLREIRRARQDENVDTPYLLRTENTVHPEELTDFHQGVWQAIWELAL